MTLCVAVALVAGACASAPRLPDDQTVRVNVLLDQVAKGVAEEDALQCLSTMQYGSVDIIDEERLIFRGRAGKAWLNELRPACKGLRRNDKLLFELHGSRACKMDRISVIDRHLFWTRTGPTCGLGKFKPLPPGYLERVDELRRKK